MAIFQPTISGSGGSAPAHYVEKTVTANGKLVNSANIINLNGVTDVGDYVLMRAYYAVSFPANTSVDLSSLTTISGEYACSNTFRSSKRITSVDLSGVTTVSGSNACSYMFSDCNDITSADLSGLTTINGNFAFQYMFQGCASLTTVYIGGTTAINFGPRTNQFTNMFQNCTQNIDVYAPAASQSAIEAMSGYPNFGATGNVTWHWNTAE